MSEDVKGTIHSTDIHQIEKGQHQPDPLEEVPRSGIAVLDDDRQRSENGIDDKKISCASQEKHPMDPKMQVPKMSRFMNTMYGVMIHTKTTGSLLL